MKNLYFSQEMVSSCAVTLHELAASYLSVRKAELDERDYNNIRKTFELAAEFLPNSGTDDWSAETLEEFQKFLIDRYSLTGVRMRVKFFRQVFNWAMRKRLVSNGLCYELSKVPPPRPDKCRRNPKRTDIKRSIVEGQLKYCPKVVADMLMTQLLTGMRPNEVCQIRLSEINKTLFEDRWIYTPQQHKNAWRGKERNILFGQAVREIIDRNSAKGRDEVFVSVRKKKIYTERNYAQTVKRIQEKFGLPKFTPYQLRHTAFTEVAVEFGTELADVFVGHKLKGSGATYDHSEIERQWHVVSRRQGSFAVKTGFLPENRPNLRIYTRE